MRRTIGFACCRIQGILPTLRSNEPLNPNKNSYKSRYLRHQIAGLTRTSLKLRPSAGISPSGLSRVSIRLTASAPIAILDPVRRRRTCSTQPNATADCLTAGASNLGKELGVLQQARMKKHAFFSFWWLKLEVELSCGGWSPQREFRRSRRQVHLRTRAQAFASDLLPSGGHPNNCGSLVSSFSRLPLFF